jgi:hypothetical protein
MGYKDSDEETKVNKIDDWAQTVFKPHRIPTPAYIEGEKFEQLQRRMMNKARPLVSDELQQIKTDEVFGTALNHLEKQFMESARAEAIRPTRVPKGTLKEVVTYDASGRPSYSYFGKCSTWLSDFTYPKKKLLGIRGDGTKFVKP